MSSPKPFFTVVIPTYNARRTLEKTLESVFAQTFARFEVIVVDNHSTDGTDALLAEVNDTRMAVEHVHNDGVIGHSRNVGIREARSEWIAFLDADDTWRPHSGSTGQERVSERPKRVLAAHDVLFVEGSRPKTTRPCRTERANVYESLLFVRNSIVTSAAVVRRDAVLAVDGFSERPDFVTVEDLDLWLRLAREGDFIFIPETLGEWYRHESNLSGQALIQAAASVAVRQSHLERWIEDNPGETRRARRLKSMIWSGASHTLVKSRHFTTGRRFALRSLSEDPLNLKAWVCLGLATSHIPL